MLFLLNSKIFKQYPYVHVLSLAKAVYLFYQTNPHIVNLFNKHSYQIMAHFPLVVIAILKCVCFVEIYSYKVYAEPSCHFLVIICFISLFLLLVTHIFMYFSFFANYACLYLI